VRKTADQQRRWSTAAVQGGGVEGAGGEAGMAVATQGSGGGGEA
jgi:hypothetical protein